MQLSRFNQYRIMWLFVFFDLPTDTKIDIKKATKFRKHLLLDGFTMLQFSIYIRHCNSRENMEVHNNRVKNWVPDRGEVIMFTLTDKQFGMMQFFKSAEKTAAPATPQQLELF